MKLSKPIQTLFFAVNLCCASLTASPAILPTAQDSAAPLVLTMEKVSMSVDTFAILVITVDSNGSRRTLLQTAEQPEIVLLNILDFFETLLQKDWGCKNRLSEQEARTAYKPRRLRKI
jgi:hypothetical protein